jgi:cell division protein FtsI (penicillin-binding protein 3)
VFFLSVIKYNDSDKTKILSLENNDKRVDIVDKNNIIVASDIKTKTLYLNRELVEDEEFIVASISKILNLDYDFLHKKIINNSTKSKFILIKRHLLPDEENKIRQLPIASMVFEDDLMRFYPHDNLFSHIIGYTNIDNDGVIGIEEYYNDYLRDYNNAPLKLTLDVKIQEAMRNELLIASNKYKTSFLVGIVMEIKTGNVLAIVSLPDFNPNVSNDRNNTFNFATYGNYELGSVFKIFTFANGIRTKTVARNSTFNVKDDISYGDFTIKDVWSIKNKKTIDIGEAFALSSNITAVQIAKRIGIEKQVEFFEKLGLLEKLNIDIKQTSFPIQPRKWREINLVTISYGYGLAVSPLHVISATNAILNNGNLITPRFSYNFNMQKKINYIMDKSDSDIIKELFRLTVMKGTGKPAHINGYNIGGKSGTSKKLHKTGYRDGEHIASFIAAFPINDPEYSIFIVADRPKVENSHEDGTGGGVVAEIVKNVILKILPFINVKYSSNFI